MALQLRKGAMKVTQAHGGKIPALDQDRAIYNMLGRKKGVVNAPGYLRLESKLSATQVITFNLLENQGVPTVTENRLKINDSFVVTSMGLFLFTVVANATTTLGNLRTYANPFIFAGAGESQNLNAIYETGQFTMTKNGIQSIPQLDCTRFKHVGTAQQGLNVSTAASNNAYQDDDHPGEKTGMIQTYTPIITFQGNDNVILQVTLSESLALAPPAGQARDNYVALIFRGFLRQNASFVGQKK